MKHVFSLLSFWLGFTLLPLYAAQAQVSSSSCNIQTASCPPFPQFQGSTQDFYAPASTDQNICLSRVTAYYQSCGSASPVTATFVTNGATVASVTYPAAASVCQIQIANCPGFPQFAGTHRDFYDAASANAAICLQRAEPYYQTCGSSSAATATFLAGDGSSQSATFPTPAVWSMGFFAGVDRTPVQDLDWDGLTHVIHASADINADGSVDLHLFGEMEADAPTLIAAAHAHGKKVLLGLGIFDFGGVNSGSNFVNVINTLGGDYAAQKIMETVNKFGYDGVDVDWELGQWVTTRDFPVVTAVLHSLRQQLGSRVLTFETLTGFAEIWPGSQALGDLDRLNIMTYDQVAFAPYTWFNSALSSSDPNARSMDSVINMYLNAGVPANKLNVGFPFYAYLFQGQGATGPYQARTNPAPASSQINYKDVINQYSGVETNPNYHWDDPTQEPWLGISNGWISFENPRSILAKAQYVNSHQLGGWIIWEIGSDYLPDQQIKHPLLNALHGEWSQ